MEWHGRDEYFIWKARPSLDYLVCKMKNGVWLIGYKTDYSQLQQTRSDRCTSRLLHFLDRNLLLKMVLQILYMANRIKKIRRRDLDIGKKKSMC